jgi:hypothetical protein
LFVQVLGMPSSEGLITMERVTLDGTKIQANASDNTFRRKEKIEAHLALARAQVKLNAQAAEEEKTAKRQAAAQRRAAMQRESRLEAALREVERLQQNKTTRKEGKWTISELKMNHQSLSLHNLHADVTGAMG